MLLLRKLLDAEQERASSALMAVFSRREQIITLAARDKVPAIYDRHGGLVSYGADLAGAYRKIGA